MPLACRIGLQKGLFYLGGKAAATVRALLEQKFAALKTGPIVDFVRADRFYEADREGAGFLQALACQ